MTAGSSSCGEEGDEEGFGGAHRHGMSIRRLGAYGWCGAALY